MIKEEFLREGTLVKHWSDTYNMMLQNETGIKYGETIDIVPCPYTYSEVEEEYIYPDYEERTYMKDERVRYEKKFYESLIDENNEVPTNENAWRMI